MPAPESKLAPSVGLVMVSTGRELAETFGDAMLAYAVPLTAVTLLVIAGRAWKTQRS